MLQAQESRWETGTWAVLSLSVENSAIEVPTHGYFDCSFGVSRRLEEQDHKRHMISPWDYNSSGSTEEIPDNAETYKGIK
jgi:hypothetical protein